MDSLQDRRTMHIVCHINLSFDLTAAIAVPVIQKKSKRKMLPVNCTVILNSVMLPKLSLTLCVRFWHFSTSMPWFDFG
uniref:Uncharacterized protein n=1 Tax=Anguilla anguilla TaxID=7936 RepID=A0A0E9WWP5_ANGAN